MGWQITLATARASVARGGLATNGRALAGILPPMRRVCLTVALAILVLLDLSVVPFAVFAVLLGAFLGLFSGHYGLLFLGLPPLFFGAILVWLTHRVRRALRTPG